MANTQGLISSKLEVFELSGGGGGGAETPIRGAYNNQKKLKLLESVLFSG